MPIEASKFINKDELIAKFYTLRAGLSVIAEETDKIKRADEERKKAECSYNDRLRYSTQQLSNIKYAIANNENKIKALEKDNEKARNQKLGVLGWILLIWWVGTTCTMVPYSFIVDQLGEGKAIVPSLICGAIGVAAVHYLIIAMRKRRAENTDIKQNNEEIIRLRNEIATLTAKTSEISAENESLSERKVSNPIVETLLETEVNYNNNILPVSTAIAKSTKQAMLRESEGILMESDWKNIDLLIFYLETGRADSLREALQLVDRQRQTDQIVSSIRDASYHISNTINAGFNRLGGLMAGCFSNLSQQIQSNHNEISGSISALEKSVKAGNREMSERIKGLNNSIQREVDRIVSSQEINNVLIKRASDSSDKLVGLLEENEKYW